MIKNQADKRNNSPSYKKQGSDKNTFDNNKYESILV